MYGIKHKSIDILHYLWRLVQEYEVVLGSQLYSFLKISKKINRNNRKRIITSLKKQISIFDVEFENKTYISSKHKTKLKITGTHLKTLSCLWVLLDYMEQADQHYAAGTYSRISMTIGEKDYDILYVENGEEALCLSHIEQNGETSYIVVMENMGQISSIHHHRVKAFATVSDIGKITYYEQTSMEVTNDFI